MGDTSTTTAPLLTAAELERLSFPDRHVELVRGRLVVREPPGTWHGRIAARLAVRVGVHVERQGLGDVYGQDTGFKIRADPDTVRAPDLAFVRRASVHRVGRRGYAAVAPDLVAEIVSADDRPGEVLAKVGDWLDAGTLVVWVIDPDRLEARIYRRDGSLTMLDRDGALAAEEVLPGFRCPLGELLS